MPVSVAEYLGQRTDIDLPVMQPPDYNLEHPCPFMNRSCDKMPRYKPICSVRKANDDLWIVCRHRLCATLAKPPLAAYQLDVLLSIAKTVFAPDVTEDNILVKREVSIPYREDGKYPYQADYVMMLKDYPLQIGQRRVILEIQGGGETSNTGKLTRHVTAWEQSDTPKNAFLSQTVGGVGTLETNAWRRQQEQFIVKGNIAKQTGGGIVFCVGAPLFDYLWRRVEGAKLNDLHRYNWTLALIGFSEDASQPPQPGPIPYTIDKNRLLFTDYNTFVHTLINQGEPAPEIFEGDFQTLSGVNVTVA